MHDQDLSIEEHSLTSYLPPPPLRSPSISDRISIFENLTRSQSSSYSASGSSNSRGSSSGGRKDGVGVGMKITFPGKVHSTSSEAGRGRGVYEASDWDSFTSDTDGGKGFRGRGELREREELNSIQLGDYRKGVGYDQVPAEGKKGEERREVERREERLRREFGFGGREGVKARKAGEAGGEGKRRRIYLRVFEGVGAVGVGLASIGATFLTHPIDTPPPAGKVQIYLLYILPFFTLAILIYFSLRSIKSTSSSPQLDQNKFVIPLLSGKEKSTSSKGFLGMGKKKSKKSRDSQTINLIVDPAMFTSLPKPKEKRRKRKREQERIKLREQVAELREELGYAEDSDTTITPTPSSSSSSEEGEIQEESKYQTQLRWQKTRNLLKKITFFDGILSLAWIGTALYSLVGEICTPCSYAGFCNLYNSAIALAVFLSFAFITSFILDFFELKRTRYPTLGRRSLGRV